MPHLYGIIEQMNAQFGESREIWGSNDSPAAKLMESDGEPVIIEFKVDTSKMLCSNDGLDLGELAAFLTLSSGKRF